MTAFALALALAGFAPPQDADGTEPERPFLTPSCRRELVLERGERARFAFRSDPHHSIGVFARSEEVDPRFELWVEGKERRTREDEGGNTTPYVRVEEADEPQVWLIDVFAGDDEAGPVILHLVRHPETDRTVEVDELGRSAVDASKAAMQQGRQGAALAVLREAADALLAVEDAEDSWRILWRAERVAMALYSSGDAETAVRCMERALRGRRVVLPPEHPHIDITERNAIQFRASFAPGEAIARAEALVDERSAEYEPGHDRILKAQDLLATCLLRAQRLSEAIRVREEIVAARPREPLAEVRRLADDYQALIQLLFLQENPPALLEWTERAVAELEPLLPSNDPELLSLLDDLAGALRRTGRQSEALELYERVVEGMREALDENSSKLLAARANRASVLKQLGHIEEATAELEDVLQRFLVGLEAEGWMQPVLWVRGTLEGCYAQLGRERDALELIELQLRGYRMRPDLYPESYPSLLRARGQRSTRLVNLGRLAEAREEIEGALAVAATVPDDQMRETRRYLLGLSASILAELGDLVRARAAYETYLAPGPPPGGIDVTWVEQLANYAQVLLLLGETERAWKQMEALDDYMRRFGPLPTRHYATLLAERSRARVLVALGRYDEALESIETVERTWPGVTLQLKSRVLGRLGDSAAAIRVLEEGTASHPHEGDPQLILEAGLFLPLHLRVLGRHDRARAVVREHAEDLVRLTIDVERTGSERDVGRFVSGATPALAIAIAFALASPDDDALGSAAFAAAQTLRGAPLVPSRLRRVAERDADMTALLGDLQSVSRRVALVASEIERASGEEREALGAELDALVRERDRKRGSISSRLVEQGAGSRVTEPASVEQVARTLRQGEAAVALHRFWRPDLEAEDFAGMRRKEARYAAAIVRADASLTWLDLGSAAEIEDLVASWRGTLGVGMDRGIGKVSSKDRATGHELGTRVRARVLDPVLATAGGVDRLVVAPSSTLGLVPWDALPDASGTLLGDVVEIALVESLRHLERAAPPEGGPSLLVVGGVAYDEEAAPVEPEEERELPVLPRSETDAFLAPLPATATEVEAIADAFEAAFPRAGATRLTGTEAAREPFLREAERARYLHVATHGWFAAELATALEPDTGGETLDAGMRVLGYAPLTLCGLALAGANRPGSGGRVTAEELAGLDLSGCELATLSACESALGLDTRGEGLASMRRALSMAGARHGLSSLWKVPDEATRDLMIAFYDALWTGGLAPRAALWEAKRRLREARDPEGAPRYGIRDWAGWVLYGPLAE